MCNFAHTNCHWKCLAAHQSAQRNLPFSSRAMLFDLATSTPFTHPLQCEILVIYYTHIFRWAEWNCALFPLFMSLHCKEQHHANSLHIAKEWTFLLLLALCAILLYFIVFFAKVYHNFYLFRCSGVRTTDKQF